MVQEDTVLDIFFDILALEFVENIDDVIFGLSKRGKLTEEVYFSHHPTSHQLNFHILQVSLVINSE